MDLHIFRILQILLTGFFHENWPTGPKVKLFISISIGFGLGGELPPSLQTPPLAVFLGGGLPPFPLQTPPAMKYEVAPPLEF